MASGFVYALVNSSLPGLVKVGKTTRLPSERVAELSGATGVATPFIVAFEQYFSDCDTAEEFVHITLERQGLRQSNNREFFRAAPNEVIRIILDAPGRLDGPPVVEAEDTAEDDGLLSGDDLEPDMNLTPSKPWDHIFEQAENHHFGAGDFIQDHQEALALYKDAARLGSLVAYERIGDLYKDGNLGREDKEKALSYYKEGAKRGNYYCYVGMANLFFGNNQIDNCSKSIKKFLSLRKSHPLKEVESYDNQFYMALDSCIHYCLQSNTRIDFIADISEHKDSFEYFLKEKAQWWEGMNSDDGRRMSEYYIGLLEWTQKNLKINNSASENAPPGPGSTNLNASIPNGIPRPQSQKNSQSSSVVLFGVAVTIVVIIGIFAVMGHF